MNVAAYNTWVELFDEDVSEMWRYERYELQKVTMLMTALRKEMNNVYNTVENDLKKLRLQLEHRDALEEISKSPPSDKKKSPGMNNKENINIQTTTREQNSTLGSPDLFKIVDQNITNNSSTIIDLSLSDDNLATTKTECSPPLNKRKKQFKHFKVTKKSDNNAEKSLGFRRDIFNPRISSDAEESVIAGTPEVSSKQVTSSVVSKQLRNVRKKKNATLTQMYRSSNNSHKMDADDGGDSDETRIDDRATQGLTELLNCMNENAEKSDVASIQSENDAFLISTLNDSDNTSPRNDAFSNAALLNDSDIASPQDVPIKKQKVEAEPVVRGKARKLLAGFSCQQCHDFYGGMNLPPEELEKRIDACSRHRYMYKPPQDTFPGFWNLTVTSQKREENDDS